MLVLVPVPETFPGFNIHVPVAGNPLNTTLPVPTLQVGCVIAPTVGAVGVAGWVLITTLPEAGEIHPVELVTVKLYVPAESEDMLVLVPVPDIFPGFNVHVPVAGKPLNNTLPVPTLQVG